MLQRIKKQPFIWKRDDVFFASCCYIIISSNHKYTHPFIHLYEFDFTCRNLIPNANFVHFISMQRMHQVSYTITLLRMCTLYFVGKDFINHGFIKSKSKFSYSALDVNSSFAYGIVNAILLGCKCNSKSSFSSSSLFLICFFIWVFDS